MEGLTPAPAAFRDLLRQKLADAGRRIQWTYSIFWVFNPEQQVLVWGEGCVHNGAESTELSLRRSQQLQELFVSMSTTNTGVSQQSSAGGFVSPQDLTPTEWFYMCSMACSFATGAGLPGKAYGEKRHVWHCVTGEGDTRAFLRAHFAQRARIQTIVCIPAIDGVVEFGTTALVEKDTYLLQQMQSVFSEQPAIDLVGTGTDSRRAREIPSRSFKKSGAFKKWRQHFPAPHRQEFLQSHQQRMLKTAVLTIPRLHMVKAEAHVESLAGERTSIPPGSCSLGRSSRGAHVVAERRRREKLNNSFVTLRGLVPSATKSDKVSLLGNAIEYVKGLETQVEELESNAKKLAEKASVQQHVEVMIEKSIAVSKIFCTWKDGLLIDILQRMINLRLEVVDATAKVSDGILKATLKAKVRSSDKDNEEKSAEIEAALLSTIEEKLSSTELPK